MGMCGMDNALAACGGAATQGAAGPAVEAAVAVAAAKGGADARRGASAPRVLLVCALALLLAALAAGVGGTWALATSAERFDLAEYFDAQLSQHYADEPVAAYPGIVVEQTAAAQNIGSKDMWVRMNLDKYWMQKDGDTWTRVDDSAGFDSDFIILHMNEDAWTQGEDGWWYSNEAVEPGATSPDLFTAIEISAETGEEVQGVAERKSMYATRAASVDVTMECTADPDALAASDKALSRPDTSDALPWALFLAAAAMLAAALVLLLAAWRRRRGRDDDAQVVEFTL